MSEQEQAVATEEIPVETAETPVVTPAGDTAKPAAAEAQPVGEKTFTQSELNEIVEKRLARERAKRERELEAEVRRLGQQQAPKVEQKPSDPAAPKRDDFDDYESYVEAKARHAAREEVRAERQAQEQATRQAQESAQRTTAQKAFDERMEAAEAKYPDFEDAWISARKASITDAMFDAMLHAEEGADLVYFFGKNPAEAHRISQLSDKAQAVEIGKLAAKLPAAPAPQKPASVSKAPEPIEPIGGASSAVINKPPDDPEEFRKWDLARQRERAAGKRT